MGSLSSTRSGTTVAADESLGVMALSDIDRSLLQRCLARKPRAWEDFVDRFMGLVVHVVNHSAQCRSLRPSAEDREDLVAQVFLTVINNEMAVLRNFRGDSSLATYLTVIARRVVVHQMVKLAAVPQPQQVEALAGGIGSHDTDRLRDREQIERLLEELEGAEAEIVRMYHLEGKSYNEISTAVGMPENSVGPTLSRARSKMRRSATE
jgi:RNA polymerase sigma-70 factor, ECF subfamily